MVDVLCCVFVGCIIVVIFYFGYVCQDCCVCFVCVLIIVKVVVDFFFSVGVDCVLIVDLYVEQIQGFFDVLVDNVFGSLILLEDMLQLNLDNLIVVFLDIGGVVCVCVIVKLLNDIDMVIIDKCCLCVNVLQVMYIIGDVVGCDCVLVDDMIDIGGMLCKAVEVLKECGVKCVFVYVIYLIFFGNAVNNLCNFVIDEVVVCDIILLSDEIKLLLNVCILILLGMLVEVICCISNEELIFVMFEY